MLFAKNEIVELKRDQSTGTDAYKKGQKFVVQKSTKTTLHLTILENGALGEKSITCKAQVSAFIFASTNTIFKAPKSADDVDVKKGMVFSFKKELKKNGIIYPVGTRVIFIKGGARPEFSTNFVQPDPKHRYVSGLTVDKAFVSEFLEPADAVVCELTKDFTLKGFKEGHGEETRNFYTEICYKKKAIGDASNDGQGGCHRIHIHAKEWDELLDKALVIAQKLQANETEEFKIISKNDIDEIIVDYLTSGRVGLIDLETHLKDYVADISRLS